VSAQPARPQPRLAWTWARSQLAIAMLVTIAVIALAIRGIDLAIQFGVVAGILAILTISINLVLGYAGMMSVAQVAFYGLGAYAIGVLTATPPTDSVAAGPSVQLSFVAALPIAVATCGIVGAILGAVVSRLQGDYLALATIGFAIVFQVTATSADGITRGPLGIHRIPPPAIGTFDFDDPGTFLVLVVATLAVVILVATAIARSQFGLVLTGIREDEDALASFGFRTSVYKLVILAVAAMMAGLAGALTAAYTGSIAPTDFSLWAALTMTAVVVIGGLASIPGSVVGAMVFVLLDIGLRFVPGISGELAGEVRSGLLGLLLLGVMVLRPQGLIGRYRV
jgi:branched-chain amino acid transport system permease protein